MSHEVLQRARVKISSIKIPVWVNGQSTMTDIVSAVPDHTLPPPSIGELFERESIKRQAEARLGKKG